MDFLNLQFIKSLVWINEAVAQGFGQRDVGGITLRDPIGTGSIAVLLGRIIDFLIYVGAPILAIMVLWGGFQILTAAGEPEKFKTGQKTIIYAVVGYGIILISKGVEFVIRDLFRKYDIKRSVDMIL